MKYEPSDEFSEVEFDSSESLAVEPESGLPWDHPEVIRRERAFWAGDYSPGTEYEYHSLPENDNGNHDGLFYGNNPDDLDG